MVLSCKGLMEEKKWDWWHLGKCPKEEFLTGWDKGKLQRNKATPLRGK